MGTRDKNIIYTVHALGNIMHESVGRLGTSANAAERQVIFQYIYTVYNALKESTNCGQGGRHLCAQYHDCAKFPLHCYQYEISITCTHGYSGYIDEYSKIC